MFNSATVYGDDVADCSSNIKAIASFAVCLTSAIVNQFSIDCQDYSIATGSAPSTFPSSADTPGSSSSGGLHTAAKAGIGIAGSIIGVMLVALFFVVRKMRMKVQQLEAGIFGANSNRAGIPLSELPSERQKEPVELPSREIIPTEAPNNGNLPRPREIKGNEKVQWRTEERPLPSNTETKPNIEEEHGVRFVSSARRGSYMLF